MTQFRAAVDSQRAAVEPKDRSVGVWPGALGRKSGFENAILKNVAFAANGTISKQFVLTPTGWKMSAMALDVERPGLSVPAT